MRGLILTGPTGVGKSTIQSQLREEHGFWAPRTYTTRFVEPNDRDLIHVPSDHFMQAARDGAILLPVTFGGNWYGWLKDDVDVLRSERARAVLNVRPYPALILQALMPSLIAVWLTLEPAELARRRAQRHAARDDDPLVRTRREVQDAEDLVYMPCFKHTCAADDRAVHMLLMLLQ